MAELSDTQLETARSWIGDKWDEDDIFARYEKFFTQTDDDDLALYYTVYEILRSMLARMIERPSALSAEGLSMSNVVNITTLRQLLNDLESGGNLNIPMGGITLSHLVRSDRVR